MVLFVFNLVNSLFSMLVRALAGARRALPRLGSVTQQRELASMEPVKYLIVGKWLSLIHI